MRGEEHSFEVLGVDDPVSAVSRIFLSRFGTRIQSALIYVLEGAGYREAARRAGLKDHRDVFRAARKLDLVELNDERKAVRDSVRYSKRDLAAIEATLRGDPTPGPADAWLRCRNEASSHLDLLSELAVHWGA